MDVATVLNNLSLIAFGEGDAEEAQQLLEESLAIYRATGSRQGIASTLGNLGVLARQRGEDEEARQLYEESLALSRELGDLWGVANLLNNLGLLHQSQGNTGAAHPLHIESLQVQQEIGDKDGITSSLESFGCLATARGEFERAARLWGAAEALREESGAERAVDEKEFLDQTMTAARAAVGDSAFTAAWSEGRILSCEQAVEFALEPR
jgi:tetratricopeptide (TPR) repeat protein